MLIESFQEDLKKSQLERNNLKVETLRLLLSELHNAKIQKGEELSDAEVLAVLQREVKKRKEAAESFTQGGRLELAEKEEAEAKILVSYLPAQLSNEELSKIIEEAIKKSGAVSVADMGKVMSAIMGKVAGRAGGARVSALVKEKLS